MEVANKARQTAERLRDELCRQNIHSNLQLIRSKEERDSALIDMARMTEIRDKAMAETLKARAEAREARQEIERLEAALRKYEVGWEASRTLGSVLGDACTCIHMYRRDISSAFASTPTTTGARHPAPLCLSRIIAYALSLELPSMYRSRYRLSRSCSHGQINNA
jgi:hypothetical protein